VGAGRSVYGVFSRTPHLLRAFARRSPAILFAREGGSEWRRWRLPFLLFRQGRRLVCVNGRQAFFIALRTWEELPAVPLPSLPSFLPAAGASCHHLFAGASGAERFMRCVTCLPVLPARRWRPSPSGGATAEDWRPPLVLHFLTGGGRRLPLAGLLARTLATVAAAGYLAASVPRTGSETGDLRHAWAALRISAAFHLRCRMFCRATLACAFPNAYSTAPSCLPSGTCLLGRNFRWWRAYQLPLCHAYLLRHACLSPLYPPVNAGAWALVITLCCSYAHPGGDRALAATPALLGGRGRGACCAAGAIDRRCISCTRGAFYSCHAQRHSRSLAFARRFSGRGLRYPLCHLR